MSDQFGKRVAHLRHGPENASRSCVCYLGNQIQVAIGNSLSDTLESTGLCAQCTHQPTNDTDGKEKRKHDRGQTNRDHQLAAARGIRGCILNSLAGKLLCVLEIALNMPLQLRRKGMP